VGRYCLVTGARDFLGKLSSKIELITILRMSEIDYLISCVTFRNATLTAARSLP
jgi:hypothetical protein